MMQPDKKVASARTNCPIDGPRPLIIREDSSDKIFPILPGFIDSI